jgi:hypothetical protein
MSADRTVLEHLLEGRDALLREIQRLTDAKKELDSVIARIGDGPDPTADGAAPDGPVTGGAPTSGREPRTRLGAGTSRPAGRTPSRAAAKKASRRAADRSGAAPKSIRLHVLEMLAAEDREFGLAEIIARIHAEGIPAHDDAVRSITVKLMKDGSVERVGRGHYRLARRPGAATPVSTGPASAAGTSKPEQAAQPAAYPPPLNLAQPWDVPQA